MVTISVAMATYNGAAYLRAQLDSLATQTLPPHELIVGDDGSTDGTRAILDEFARSAPFKVQVTRNPQSLGYGENFIRTAARCSGDWIAFCDQDDVWLPHKLRFCVDRIAASPTELRLLNHEAVIVGHDLQPKGRLYNQISEQRHERLSLPPEWFSFGLTQVFSARLLRELPHAPRVSFPWHEHREAHDVWIALLANLTGSILLSPEPLVLYRRHENTATVSRHHSIAMRARDKLRDNGATYRHRADYLDSVARRVSELADLAGESELARKLDDAAVQIGQRGSFFEQRSSAYMAGSRREAVSELTALYRRGAYTNGPWRFGRKRFLKDAGIAALAVGRRSRA